MKVPFAFNDELSEKITFDSEVIQSDCVLDLLCSTYECYLGLCLEFITTGESVQFEEIKLQVQNRSFVRDYTDDIDF